jgi:hypothetical protein
MEYSRNDNWKGKCKVPRENTDPKPLCPLEILCRLDWNFTRISAMESAFRARATAQAKLLNVIFLMFQLVGSLE